ncbi:transposase [Streptantibioticus rubrisoli]|uniref:IS110 family transposase n=1 Tax=Streptantibioticus rubrisoli TaxID=1387313 RepID=UPI0035581C77
MADRPARLWVGIDAGKAHHWMTAIDATGATIWSRKVPNDESEILSALGEILALAEEVCWAVGRLPAPR